jgi:hypothetical protein
MISLLLGASFFLILLSTSSIPGGDDSYRHLKMASRLATEPSAVFRDPWLLPYAWPKPVDAWFGYHLLLAPFTVVLPVILATKLFTSLIYTSLAYVSILLLRQLDVEYPILWAMLIVAGSGTALYRATLSRPFLLCNLMVLLALYFTLRGKPIAVGLISALHAASYSIFVFVGLAPAMAFLLRRDRRSLRTFLASGAGMAIGLLSNPYFPENVRFDVICLALVNIARRAHVQLGIELEPITFWWFAASAPVMVVWILALFRFVKRRPALRSEAWLLFALSLVTLAASIQVSRTMDLFVPMAVSFAAVMLSSWVRTHRRDFLYLMALPLLICGGNAVLTYFNMRQAVPHERFLGISRYLEANAAGELIANAQWDEYPFLYFWNSRNRYVIGIDPTLLYLSDPRKYWFWRHIAEDETGTCDHERCAPSESGNIAQAVLNGLHARYILTEHARNPRVEAALTADNRVREVYRDAECSLFSIKD